MYTYPYSFSTDFGGTISISQLHSEISDVLDNFVGITRNDDQILILFSIMLASQDELILNHIVSLHDPAATVGSLVTNIPLNSVQVNRSVYTLVGSFEFPGTVSMSEITNIKAISSMDLGGMSYSIRIIDVANRQTIVEKLLTNTDEINNDLGTISNLPETPSIFEIHIKVVGQTVAYVKNISIYHE